MKSRRTAGGRQSRGNGDMLYGRQPVLEALRARRRSFKGLVWAEGIRPCPLLDEIEALARSYDLAIRTMDRQQLTRMVDGGNHQGVLLDAGGYPYVSLDELRSAVRGKAGFLLLLDHLQDPQNLGALLRTAESAGVDGVLIPADRAVGVTGAAARASAGAAEHMRVCRVANLVRTMCKLRDDGFWFYGLDGGESASPYTEHDFSGSVGIVVGSEGSGLGRLVGETCDELMRLPQLGRINSLNAAIAGAIALYEVVRQRQRADSAT